MSFSLESMWESMGLLAKGVSITLLVMGLLTVAVVVERWIVLFRSRRNSRRFAREVGPLIEGGHLEQAAVHAEKFPASHLATLLGAGLRTFLEARAKGSAANPIELTKRELARRSEVVGASLRRGLGILASVGSVAPFVGLFGTVVGIISAFHGIAETGSGGISSVAGGIAEALVVTGLGLAVAVPAVLFFNWLSARFDAMQLALDTAASELLDQLEVTLAGGDAQGIRERRAEDRPFAGRPEEESDAVATAAA
jgi:biopolymer transport protein ExbB